MKTVEVINYHAGRKETYELASFLSRLLARIIDTIIIFIPAAIIPLIPPWLYWAIMQSGDSNATVGQQALGIKIVDVNGGEVTFGKTTGKFFGNFLNLLTFFIGYFMFFFTEKNQCLHDLVSGCLVVKEEPLDTEFSMMDNLVE